jgi:hypothetical protein
MLRFHQVTVKLQGALTTSTRLDAKLLSGFTESNPKELMESTSTAKMRKKISENLTVPLQRLQDIVMPR